MGQKYTFKASSKYSMVEHEFKVDNLCPFTVQNANFVGSSAIILLVCSIIAMFLI